MANHENSYKIRTFLAKTVGVGTQNNKSAVRRNKLTLPLACCANLTDPDGAQHTRQRYKKNPPSGGINKHYHSHVAQT